jgi:hypothetical protein
LWTFIFLSFTVWKNREDNLSINSKKVMHTNAHTADMRGGKCKNKEVLI